MTELQRRYSERLRASRPSRPSSDSSSVSEAPPLDFTRCRRLSDHRAFIAYIQDEVSPAAFVVHVGIDPGARNCGIAIWVRGACFSETLDLTAHREYVSPDILRKEMYDPVKCACHVVDGFKNTESWHILNWLTDMSGCMRVILGVETVQEGPTNYWAAAWAAAFRSMFTFALECEVHGVQSRSAKANVGIPLGAGHSENKRLALKTVTVALGLEVDDDHQADAWLILLATSLPRHRGILVPGKRPGTSKIGDEPHDDYQQRVKTTLAFNALLLP